MTTAELIQALRTLPVLPVKLVFRDDQGPDFDVDLNMVTVESGLVRLEYRNELDK